MLDVRVAKLGARLRALAIHAQCWPGLHPAGGGSLGASEWPAPGPAAVSVGGQSGCVWLVTVMCPLGEVVCTAPPWDQGSLGLAPCTPSWWVDQVGHIACSVSSLTPDLPRCQSPPWGQHGPSALTAGLASCQTPELVAVSTCWGPGCPSRDVCPHSDGSARPSTQGCLSLPLSTACLV